MTRNRLSTHDQGARYCGPNRDSDTEYAAVEFEHRVRRAERDGVITQDEAMELTMEHARLQDNSRRHLRDLLESYGFKDVVLSGDPGTPAAKLAGEISRVIKTRRVVLPPTPDVDTLFESVGRPMLPIFEGIGDAVLGRRKIPQKVTWLSIVGPAALAALLRVVGIV